VNPPTCSAGSPATWRSNKRPAQAAICLVSTKRRLEWTHHCVRSSRLFCSSTGRNAYQAVPFRCAAEAAAHAGQPVFRIIGQVNVRAAVDAPSGVAARVIPILLIARSRSAHVCHCMLVISSPTASPGITHSNHSSPFRNPPILPFRNPATPSAPHIPKLDFPRILTIPTSNDKIIAS
jgi:hypothetical protein